MINSARAIRTSASTLRAVAERFASEMRQHGVRPGDAALVAIEDGESAEQAEAVGPDIRRAERLRLERMRDDADHAERRQPVAFFRDHRRARPLDVAIARFEIGPGFERRPDRTLVRRRRRRVIHVWKPRRLRRRLVRP